MEPSGVEPSGIEPARDVRRNPGSRRHPHFARGPLAATLAAAGIGYAHASDPGAHREPPEGGRHDGLGSPFLRG